MALCFPFLSVTMRAAPKALERQTGPDRIEPQMAKHPSTRKLPPMAAGQRYGRLVAIKRVGTRPDRLSLWSFYCDCGTKTVAVAHFVRRGKKSSCGCLLRECRIARNIARATHQMTHTPTYTSWKSMIQRCYDHNYDAFYRYGGRGIVVCERWRTFENFLADMGERPKGKTIDRYPDNDGNYEPRNVRWATPKEQTQNRRKKLRK